ncbi:Uncharacterised protein [uncultured archaeon]|nr:Uncharacterised protein [uncultured archaeon]
MKKLHAPLHEKPVQTRDDGESPFLGIKREQLELLKDRIEHSRGTVIMLVHPWYDNSPWDTSCSEVKNFAKYQSIITDLLVNGSRPMVVLEELRKMQGTEKRLESIGARNYIIVPTEKDRSVPLLESGIVRKCGAYDYTKLFGELYDVLTDAGARTMLIAGLQSTDDGSYSNDNVDKYERRWLDRQANPPGEKTYDVNRCVGMLYQGLIDNAVIKTPEGQEPPAIRIIPCGVYPSPPWYHIAKKEIIEKNRKNAAAEPVLEREAIEKVPDEDEAEISFWNSFDDRVLDLLRN